MIEKVKHFIRTQRAKKALKRLRKDRIKAQKLLNLMEQAQKEENRMDELKKALFALVEPQLKKFTK